jgi:hypothetical protein
LNQPQLYYRFWNDFLAIVFANGARTFLKKIDLSFSIGAEIIAGRDQEKTSTGAAARPGKWQSL